jgi:uncharacterized RDD family membrane protein YckC
VIEWYYAEDDERRGPVSESEFKRLVDLGQITGNTLLWNTEMGEQWVSYGSIESGAAAGADGAPGGDYQCVECGLLFAGDEVIDYDGTYVCGGCKGIFFQRLREGGALHGTLEYAGFWLRVGAYVIDMIVMMVFFILYLVVVGLVGNTAGPGSAVILILTFGYLFLSFAFPILYRTLLHGRFGATLGKMALGLLVVRSDSERITYLRAFGRSFAELLSSFFFGVGYLLAAFDDEKRALHDHICDTRVIRVR